jgi:SET domain-containing protein
MINTFTHSTYPKAWIRLKPSITVKGEIGAFAAKDFKKNEVIVRDEEFQDNNVMTIDEYNHLDKVTKELVTAHSTITIGDVYMPANINYLRPINYFNHSCEPNVGFNERGDYVAMKDILSGSEFLLDYSFLNTNPDYILECSCGSVNCRKIITGNEWKNKDFVEKNKDYFYSSVRNMLATEQPR